MIWTVATDFGPLVVREQIEPDDEPGILELFAACDDWFEAVTGGPSGHGDVQSLFYSLPEGRSFEDKRLYTVRDGEKIVGLVDAVLGYPHRTAVAVGQFLVAPSHRGRGAGTAVAGVLIAEARAAGLEQVTATAHDAWPAGQAFLRTLGFTVGPDGEPPARRATLALGG
ncbi:GNAT family N-acetyltransferase [Jiangella mangrovi]|uniref:GNAT superfamily N-acetyltransferase n=1 Tax=Jiangella mangrovi TaxID=1524084 RepID=A0A7W9GMM7_9ACTN|nr:GNAT superfamily N-acetyltransferase [Jiangella mangrovi]